MSWGYIAVGVGTLAAGLINGSKKAPTTAPLAKINAQDSQTGAVQGNINNEGDIESLLTRANTFTQGQANDLLEQSMPGYGKLASKFTDIANQDLNNANSGTLPQDVQDNLSRIAAERGISTGVRGQAGDFSLLRDFGISSLDYRNQQVGQAQSIFGQLSSQAPRVNPLSPISLYVTPAQQIAAQSQNAQGAQAVQQAGNNASAAANNANASMWSSTVAGIAGIAGGYLKTSNNGGTTPSTTTPKQTDPYGGGAPFA